MERVEYSGKLNRKQRQIIPLFHTGHESPESPRIDFFSYSGGGGGGGGIREVSLFFLSNRDEL